jgi:hypothetical protein
MHELPRRFALALLLLTGLSLVLAPAAGETLAMQYRATLLALLGAALALAPWLAALRLPAVAAALLAQLSWLLLALKALPAGADLPVVEFLQVLALLAAGTILVREARREARWNGLRPLRQES